MGLLRFTFVFKHISKNGRSWRKYSVRYDGQSLTICLNNPDAISVKEIGVIFLRQCYESVKRKTVSYLRAVGRSSNGELGISDVNAVPSTSLITIFRGLPA
jgi:hypothetical protein